MSLCLAFKTRKVVLHQVILSSVPRSYLPALKCAATQTAAGSNKSRRCFLDILLFSPRALFCVHQPERGDWIDDGVTDSNNDNDDRLRTIHDLAGSQGSRPAASGHHCWKIHLGRLRRVGINVHLLGRSVSVALRPCNHSRIRNVPGSC